MKFVVSTYQDEGGMYIAECPSIPGCVSQGQTEAEAETHADRWRHVASANCQGTTAGLAGDRTEQDPASVLEMGLREQIFACHPLAQERETEVKKISGAASPPSRKREKKKR